ncbi:hypothetical protein AGMMS49579_01210 [Spirochaetia bacterium]|nr:hypothetical protein AGMMS49579_01210 [Spirochaetia bacterium]
MALKSRINKCCEEVDKYKEQLTEAQINELKEGILNILTNPKNTVKKNCNATGLKMAREPTDKLIKFMAYPDNNEKTYSYLLLNKKICSYVKDNNLQTVDNKKNFKIDNVLRELLNVNEDIKELSFTSVMNYYSQLFVQTPYQINKNIANFANNEVSFNDWCEGSYKTLNEIQNMIYEYIKQHNLEQPDYTVAKSKRKINIDDKLKSFLKIKGSDNIISQTQFERYVKASVNTKTN